MNSTKKFLRECEAFIKASRITQAQFGREAVNDTGFISKVRGGRSPSLATADRVYQYMKRKSPGSPPNTTVKG